MKNHIKVRFSTILLCIPAILLCTAPCGAKTVESGETLNVGTGMDVEQIENNDYLMVKGGTVNLYPGAYVDGAIYAFDGSAVNIYAGELGANSYITLLGINSTASTAVVTVYGTGFKVDGELLDTSATQFTVGLINGGVLTGNYENGDPINLLFLSEVPIHLVNLDDEVEIDIKPGSNPNSINLKSWGVVPVAVLTTNDFDASNVDPGTVLFAGASPLRWKMIKDVDGDGDKDMLLFFKKQDLMKGENNPEGLDENSTEAMLTGETTDGKVIQGTDEVRIVPRKKYYKWGRNRGRYIRARRGRHRTTEEIE